MGKTVDMGVTMRPTARMMERQLSHVPDPVDLQDLRSLVSGGEVSMRVCEAPGIPGKWLGAVVEQWPNGHVEILGACHGSSAAEVSALCMPRLEAILTARRV